ncbi:MAG: HI0074 family nucleotidyltransferase substrate-binding subunit [Verrucomicrobiota bacterium]
MNYQDIRWKQRLDSLSKAMVLLNEAAEIEAPSQVEQMGLIQTFEVCYELGWKLLQDYLKHLGHNPKSPRETIKQAYQDGLITDGDTWLRMTQTRNLTTHTYDRAMVLSTEETIKEHYLSLLNELHDDFHRRADAD